MIKNDAIDNIFDLNYRWGNLVVDVLEDNFDYEYFKPLAVHTFALLFEYKDAQTLPREIMKILFKIKEFASYFVEISLECEMAQAVATAFCDQIEGEWLKIDGEYDENRFAVCDLYGMEFTLDANTFDLSVMME